MHNFIAFRDSPIIQLRCPPQVKLSASKKFQAQLQKLDATCITLRGEYEKRETLLPDISPAALTLWKSERVSRVSESGGLCKDWHWWAAFHPPLKLELRHEMTKSRGAGGRIGDYLCLDCATLPYAGWCNQFTNTKFTIANNQLSKSTHDHGHDE